MKRILVVTLCVFLVASAQAQDELPFEVEALASFDQPWALAFLPDGSPNPDRKAKVQTNNLQSIAHPELDKLIESYRASEDAEEMKRLAFKMEQVLYDDASFSPGFVQPFYRVGYWRWIRWPDDFNVKISQGSGEWHLDWMDVDAKPETLQARKKGDAFPKETMVYDQYADKPDNSG